MMNYEMREEAMVGHEHGVSKKIEGSRSGGERSEPERRAPSCAARGVVALRDSKPPDPEVPSRARRRKFSAEYKKRILEEAEACKGQPGAKGALLRREGLYSSHLTTWGKQREKAELDGLRPKKRGRKAKPINPLVRRVRELESESKRLEKQLEKAETIILFQKKLSEMLGISPGPKETDKIC